MRLGHLSKCLLLAVATAALCGTGSVYAQSSAAPARVRWEYCAITESFGATGRNGAYEGVTKVVYFGDGGARERVVRVDGEPADGQAMSANALETARLAALSKAIWQLGESGWELVGELPNSSLSTTGDARHMALYFKRRRD